MARVVFVSSMPGMSRSSDRLTAVLVRLAFVGAVIGATSTGWSRGGFLGAILYGLGMAVAFPFLLMIGMGIVTVLYPVLAIPGSVLATKLGWTNFSPYVVRRLWLQRISVLLLLVPLAIFAQRNFWPILSFFANVILFGLIFTLILVALVAWVLMRKLSSVTSQHQSAEDFESSFRWIKPDSPRLPPPRDD